MYIITTSILQNIYIYSIKYSSPGRTGLNSLSDDLMDNKNRIKGYDVKGKLAHNSNDHNFLLN